MSHSVNQDQAELAQAELVRERISLGQAPEVKDYSGHMDVKAEASSNQEGEEEIYEDTPNEEELATLRRVSGHINWSAYSIAFCELAERFSYYGTSVLYTNYVNFPLPEKGSGTGAVGAPDGQPGALGMGQRAAQGISLFNQFWAYLVPLFGAWLADSRLGRYKVIHIAILVSFVAHIILTGGAAPSVIKQGDVAFAPFIIGLICLGCGTGLFKANISPLLAEQNHDRRIRVETTKTGERVIVDPAITNTRIFLYFYWAINVGALAGQISMVFVERYVGFWVAFLLPTVLFIASPIVLALNKKRYTLTPPTGSVLSKFTRMWTYAWKNSPGKFSWDAARPCNVPVGQRPDWMTYDDAWVDEVRRGLLACRVFLFLPVFFLAYNQMTGNLTSMAASMELHGAPNDVIQNLNPITLLVIIPILDRFIYPGLRKVGIHLTPLKRMTLGFFIACMSMVAAAVTQYYIYKKSSCGWYASANNCDEAAPLNVWIQCLPYILVGIAEVFTNTTSYEYAFSKAPENMKSLVMSVNLFMSAISAAIGQALTPLSADPLLIWNYTVVAGIAFVGGCLFWFCFRNLDKQEDELNNLQKSEFHGRNQVAEARQDGDQA